MLVNATHLKGLVIRATDGELGSVDEFYFDDETHLLQLATRVGRNLLIPNKAMPANAKS